jgi:hypothetical protein
MTAHGVSRQRGSQVGQFIPIDLLLPRLDRVIGRGPGNWMACCPAHRDQSPSLSIRELDDGRVLIWCFGGCSAAEVVAAVGLDLADLFPPSPGRPHGSSSRTPKIAWTDVFDAIETALIALSLAWRDHAGGSPLSQVDADYMAAQATRLSELIAEVRRG